MIDTSESTNNLSTFPSHVDLDTLIRKAEILSRRQEKQQVTPTKLPQEGAGVPLFSKKISRGGFLRLAAATVGLGVAQGLGFSAFSKPTIAEPVLPAPQSIASKPDLLPTPKPAIPEPNPIPTFMPKSELPKPPEVFPTPNPYLGFRNNIPEFMVWVKRAGAQHVRIDGGSSQAAGYNELTDYNVRACLQKAKELDLKVLYVFNPGNPLIEKEIDRRLEAIFASGANITLEIGNEPDNLVPEYWQKRDLATYGQFVKSVLDRIVYLKRAGKIPTTAQAVVGALTDQTNTDKLIAGLKKAGISDIKSLTYAVHAYGEEKDVRERIKTVKQATNGARIIITELGVDSVDEKDQPIMENVEELPQMYAAARELINGPIFIHELPYTERNPTGAGFGFVKAADSKPLPSFYTLRDAIARIEQQEPWQRNFFQTQRTKAY